MSWADDYLTESEINYREHIASLVPAPPPSPWKDGYTLDIGGLLAVGWGTSNWLYLLSTQGTGIVDRGGNLIERIENGLIVEQRLYADKLHHWSEQEKTYIDIFGEYAGDGIHMTRDGWRLTSLAPYWPLAVPGLISPKLVWPQSVFPLHTSHIGGWLKFGFSPDESCFVVASSSGIQVFFRQ